MFYAQERSRIMASGYVKKQIGKWGAERGHQDSDLGGDKCTNEDKTSALKIGQYAHVAGQAGVQQQWGGWTKSCAVGHVSAASLQEWAASQADMPIHEYDTPSTTSKAGRGADTSKGNFGQCTLFWGKPPLSLRRMEWNLTAIACIPKLEKALFAALGGPTDSRGLGPKGGDDGHGKAQTCKHEGLCLMNIMLTLLAVSTSLIAIISPPIFLFRRLFINPALILEALFHTAFT
ncbi:uncharacterized protein EI90DRAFT_3288863 [Cantharellus anzutake]|uniref:uncharacterized protein n=1 Tax=Cantharellus anzutake TaxID=1750568 RepID=UPI00190393BA|nr:uncharacterized protein EI90DRAFT_3288863 [Cantharellus anzutake]KAF8332640.1 hypothetical protein EI90DRAFT_3288863 [Cantharellus anzutake]